MLLEGEGARLRPRLQRTRTVSACASSRNSDAEPRGERRKFLTPSGAACSAISGLAPAAKAEVLGAATFIVLSSPVDCAIDRTAWR